MMTKKIMSVILAVLMCISMCTLISAHDHTDEVVVDEVEVAALYPSCSNCGGTTRSFSATGSSSHIVRCRSCGTLITTESCSALSSATCTCAANCVCGREMNAPLGHSWTIAALDSSTHGTVCTRSGCSYNPGSYGYTGSLNSQSHSINYSYSDYTHNTTGERWHAKSGTCSVCGYNYYATTRCSNQGKPCNRVSCFN